MDEKERLENLEEDLSLESIMREFGGEPVADAPESPRESVLIPPVQAQVQEEPVEKIQPPVAEAIPAAEEAEESLVLEVAEEPQPAEELSQEDTIAMKPLAATEKPEDTVTADTIRLDTTQFTKGEAKNAVVIDDEDEPVIVPPEEKEAFTENWEPEYEQPMGEFVPEQSIIAHPRSWLRELKRKLVAGPEKRYYELTELGVGKLQISMFFCFLAVVGAVVLAIFHNNGAFGPDRLRFVIFAQLFLMLMTAVLGSFQLIKGVEDLFRLRFSLDTLLVISFVACCVDAGICLQELRVPCCAVFCLEMFMSLWSSYHRRVTEIGEMDTMRKASRLDKISACPDYLDGKKGLLQGQGQVEDFMDQYKVPSGPEKIQGWYALGALLVSIGIAVFTYLSHGLSQAVSILSISLLAAVPATAFISLTRPMAILEKRLHTYGTVLCGWQGVKGLSGKTVFPLKHKDLFPAGSVKMNGVKFFGNREPDEIVAYCTALVNADGGGLAPLFNRVLDSRNGRHYDVENLQTYEGGIGGEVCSEPVLVGQLTFLRGMGVEIPEGIRVDRAVYVSIDGELCGLFAISYEKAKTTAAALSALCSYKGLSVVLEGTDFMLTESFLRERFGINPKRLGMLNSEQLQQVKEKELAEDAPGLILTTKQGIAPIAFGITGARALRTASKLGLLIHILGGVVGMAVVLILTLTNGLSYLSPLNMFLYQLVWLVPGWLVTNWTRQI